MSLERLRDEIARAQRHEHQAVVYRGASPEAVASPRAAQPRSEDSAEGTMYLLRTALVAGALVQLGIFLLLLGLMFTLR